MVRIGETQCSQKINPHRKKPNVDEILSDVGNSPIINDYVEREQKLFLKHKSLFTRLMPQAYYENHDCFRVLWRDSSL